MDTEKKTQENKYKNFLNFVEIKGHEVTGPVRIEYVFDEKNKKR